MPHPDAADRRSPHGRVRLVVVYGGRSAEHEVSCVSALHVLRSADPERYDVSLVGVTTSGRWVDADPLLAEVGPGTSALPSPDAVVEGGEPGGSGPALPAGLLEPGGPATPVVFPVLHGPYGEDGTVQGLFETAGLAYVGAGVVSSSAAMDKGVAKALLHAAGLPQVRHLVLGPGDVDDTTAKRVEADLGWPVFVKPANLGSSIGVSRAADGGSFGRALRHALRYDEWVIVEEAVRAREIEVGVLGPAGELRASVPGEIRPSRDFYDFDDKYLLGAAGCDIPADLPPGVADEAGELALAAARALRVEGLARVDLFFEQTGRGLLVNEVNTMPGLTPSSLFPLVWAAAGLDGPAVLDVLVDLALDRHRRRSTLEVRRLPA